MSLKGVSDEQWGKWLRHATDTQKMQNEYADKRATERNRQAGIVGQTIQDTNVVGGRYVGGGPICWTPRDTPLVAGGPSGSNQAPILFSGPVDYVLALLSTPGVGVSFSLYIDGYQVGTYTIPDGAPRAEFERNQIDMSGLGFANPYLQEGSYMEMIVETTDGIAAGLSATMKHRLDVAKG